MVRRHALSDAAWQQIQTLFDFKKSTGRPSKWSDREILDAILWILKTGAPWRDLPNYYPPWKSVYTRFRRMTRDGRWSKVLEHLAKQQDAEVFMIDATIVRAHQHSAGGKGGSTRIKLVVPAGDSRRRSTRSSMRSATR
jgi:transposase